MLEEKLIFRGGSTQSIREEFQERARYAAYQFAEGSSVIDTIYKDVNYGSLNENFEPVTIVTDEQFSNLEEFEQDNNYVQTLPFVFRAFNKFRDEYEYVLDNSTLELPKYIDSVAPTRGLISFDESYNNYMDFMVSVYLSNLKTDPSVVDFETFLIKVKELINGTARDFPLTRSGFAISKNCSIMTTGLCLELATLDYNTDSIKGEMLSGKEYRCFVEFANSYGFSVDKNAPWRLVANLSSDVTKQEIVFGKDIPLEESIDFFNSVYRVKVHNDEIFSLRDFIIVLYGNLITGQDVSIGAMYNGENFEQSQNIITQATINLKPELLLEINLLARYIELGKPLESYKKDLKKLLDLYAIYGSIELCAKQIGKISSIILRETYGT